MKFFIKIFFVACCLMINHSISSQEIEHQAPSLQVGLDGLSFSKGSLDPEIIARIISQKQSEIKLKIIQNSFLQNIYGSGGTIYNYADNVIKGVVQEPDTDVRSRKILESTVNLVFVYAFADYYLKQSSNSKTTLIKLQALANGYKLAELKDFSNGLNYRGLVERNYNGKKLDAGIKKISSSGLITKSSTKGDNDHLYKFMSLIIDMTSEIVRKNEKLRDLGLMRISYSSNYDYLNKYKQLTSFEKVNSNDSLISSENYKLAKVVFEDMEAFMHKHTSYIGALKYIIEVKSFKSNDLASSLIPRNPKVIDLNTIQVSDVSFSNVIETLSDKFIKASEKNEHVNENYLKNLETAIEKLTACRNYYKKTKEFLEEPNIDIGEKVLLISDILYSFKMEVIPNIEYSIKFAPELLKQKDEIDKITKELFTLLVDNVPYLNKLDKDPAPFIQLASKLYEFNKAKTFSEYTKLITLLDEIFETGKIKHALSTINTFVKDYVIIKEDDNGKEKLEFNVESFLVKLDNIQSDKIRRLKFHFTVGMNTTSFINGNIDIGDNTQISNISHFSEKVGLKFKLINRGDWLPKNPGETYKSYFSTYTKVGPPKEPLISNWHLLLYGSGILYNVVNSSTNKEFNYPMVGFGTGITFYNALDFNVSIGIPLLENGGFSEMTKHPFIGFGFDIQIGEYFKEVVKKRNDNKNLKTIEAISK